MKSFLFIFVICLSSLFPGDYFLSLFKLKSIISDMNTTYEEYKNWLKDVPIDPNVERKYKAALELLAPRRILEDRLAAQGNLLRGIDNKPLKGRA